MAQKKERIVPENKKVKEDIRRGREGMDNEGPSSQKKRSYPDPMEKFKLSRKQRQENS